VLPNGLEWRTFIPEFKVQKISRNLHWNRSSCDQLQVGKGGLPSLNVHNPQLSNSRST